MVRLVTYTPDMQRDIEAFFYRCFTDLGWEYEPHGRHSDTVNIRDAYMKGGCMWCLYEGSKLIGTVAIRTIDALRKIAELKRLYVLQEHQGKGYGRMLFEKALEFCKENCFSKVCLDTRKDRAASQHLSRTHGFHEVERYNDNNYAELFFELDLADVGK